MKFKRQFDDKYKGSPSEITFGPSQTVPDMSIPVRELLERHSRGIGLGVALREGHYFEEDELPQILDITDLQARRRMLLQLSAEIEDRIKKEREAVDIDVQDPEILTPEDDPEDD